MAHQEFKDSVLIFIDKYNITPKSVIEEFRESISKLIIIDDISIINELLSLLNFPKRDQISSKRLIYIIKELQNITNPSIDFLNKYYEIIDKKINGIMWGDCVPELEEQLPEYDDFIASEHTNSYNFNENDLKKLMMISEHINIPKRSINISSRLNIVMSVLLEIDYSMKLCEIVYDLIDPLIKGYKICEIKRISESSNNLNLDHNLINNEDKLVQCGIEAKTCKHFGCTNVVTDGIFCNDHIIIYKLHQHYCTVENCSQIICNSVYCNDHKDNKIVSCCICVGIYGDKGSYCDKCSNSIFKMCCNPKCYSVCINGFEPILRGGKCYDKTLCMECNFDYECGTPFEQCIKCKKFTCVPNKNNTICKSCLRQNNDINCMVCHDPYDSGICRTCDSQNYSKCPKDDCFAITWKNRYCPSCFNGNGSVSKERLKRCISCCLFTTLDGFKYCRKCIRY